MNAYYQSLRQQADQLFHKFNDVVDDPAATGGLKQEIRDIVEWCEMEKNPRSIEDKIKHVEEELREISHKDAELIDRGHVDMLLDMVEHLRENVRRMPNY
jgi:polyhydroxyalkanoate synthesis regulator phasin